MIADSPISVRKVFYVLTILYLGMLAAVAPIYLEILWTLVIGAPLILLGLRDVFQKSQTVPRNFPIIGHLRYLLEEIRPELYQYFVESDTGGRPFNRLERSLVYQRAKNARDTVPFGTQQDVYEVGYEWVNHSLKPAHLDQTDLRATIGGPDCKQPYSASLLNISAMSYVHYLGVRRQEREHIRLARDWRLGESLDQPATNRSSKDSHRQSY